MAHKKSVTESSETEPVSRRTRSNKQKTKEEPHRLSDHTEDLVQETKNNDNMVTESGKSVDKNMDKGLSENVLGDNKHSSSKMVTESKSDTMTRNDNPYKVIDDERNETNVEVTESFTQFSEDGCNIVRKRHEINKETPTVRSYMEKGQLDYDTKLNRNEKKHAKNVEIIDHNIKHIKASRKFPWYVLCAAVVVLVLILYWIMTPGQNDEVRGSHTDVPNTRYQSFQDKIELVKIKYLKQTERFWRIVESQLKRLLTETTENYPAVIMIAIPLGQSQTGMCLALDIIHSINNVYGGTFSDTFIDLRSLKGESAAKRKQDLDELLQAALNTNKGVLLDHLEMLEADVALLLHGYCDGDNAPFKSSAIFLLLHTNFNSTSLHDMSVSDTLTELWQAGLGKDEFDALVSRIANNIAAVENEDNFKCNVTEM
ncbi:torsin-1A-interacting protein 1-like [Mercenaria mercenaria]|uniref:torsin-1A-interacting protein 1-like n=1 Tax=Mercenaria mercenaria TaxID=6596 RepID=UPI00234F61EA|nr:torsin-1A-interacting protein 1-like [Mercenaria mercenaria]